MRATFWVRVGLGVAAGVGVAVAVLARTAPVYEASTSVLVEPMPGTELNMRTETELVRSTQTVTDAFARMTGDPVHPPTTVGRLVDVELVAGTSVLVITFEAGTAEAASAGATAFAEAYLAARDASERNAINDQITSTTQRLDDVRNQLDEVNALIGEEPANAPELDSLRSSQASLTTQAAALTAQLNELQTAPVNPGRVVASAQTPSAPVRPVRALYLGLAAVLGAVAGGVAHLALTRWSRRVRYASDLRRHRGVGVLAELQPDALSTAGGHLDPAGRTFNRLRNEVVAALRDDDHTVILTGAASGAASMLVAANLAAAFARAGSDVVLVGAHVPDLGSAALAATVSADSQVTTLAGIFDLADIPGLTDVLAGRTSLSRAVQQAARSPRLRVVTPGGTASASGLLQSEGARSVLRQLAARTRYVIVDAPSTASGADAQSLASAADVAVLVVEAGNARHAQIADAVTQLARVGTRLLGAVFVPPLDEVELPGQHHAARVHGRAHDETEAWIGAGPDALDGPTRKLHPVNRSSAKRDEAAPGRGVGRVRATPPV
jgi:Mrp family chromosome partitioning ATPase